MTRDGFDFLVYYLSDYDYASHAQGPDAAHDELARCDEAVASLIAAAGGEEEFLERYAVILCADHGQTAVSKVARLEDVFPDLLVTASNRAGMVYADGELAPLAGRLDGHEAVDVVLYREGGRGGRAPRRRGVAVYLWARRISRRAATRRSSTIRTDSSGPGPRSRIRTRESCSSRPRRAGSSAIWPAATTPAGARTARS